MGVLTNGLLPPAQKSLRSSEQRLDSKTPTFQEGDYNNRHGGQMEKSQKPQEDLHMLVCARIRRAQQVSMCHLSALLHG